jgi:PPM family protein phosphatase
MNVPGGLDLRYGAATDVGLVREVNEDSYLADPPVFVVADGMGGHDGGDIASRFAVEGFAALAEAGYDPRRAKDAVLATFRACRQRLSEYGASRRGSDGGPWLGGTTTVVAMLEEGDDGPRWLLVNLGDSRIYRYADGLHRVSTDHSVVQELVDAGRISEREALVHPERHIVTRALGSPDPLEPDFFEVPFADAPRVLLCSDGVTDLVRDAEIAELLEANADAADAARAVVGAALRSGGVDNATALVVDVVGWADHQREKPGALP